MRITLTDKDLRAILRVIGDRAFVLVCSMALALLSLYSAKVRGGL